MHRYLESLINELRAGNALRADGVRMQGEHRFSAEELVRRFDHTADLFERCPDLPHNDADESSNLARQLLFVQAKEVTNVYVALKALKLLPVDGSVPSGAE